MPVSVAQYLELLVLDELELVYGVVNEKNASVKEVGLDVRTII